MLLRNNECKLNLLSALIGQLLKRHSFNRRTASFHHASTLLRTENPLAGSDVLVNHQPELENENEIHPFLQSSVLQHWFKNWQEKRRHKLTASTFAGAIGFFPQRRVHLWKEKVGLIKPFSGNLATCWSNIKEEEALGRYKCLTDNHLIFPEFQVYGKEKPNDDWIAASPDGVVYGLPSRGVLEIKCPFFNGDMSQASPWKRLPLYCIPQAQGLMEIMDCDWMDFYVWTIHGSSLFRIHRDEQYWEMLKVALSDFWWNHVQPASEFYKRNEISNGLIELEMWKPQPRHESWSTIVKESRRVVNDSELLIREINGKLQYY
ncbi:uncharacterized protein LOC124915434 [Impatiens glandulifera]|uniref:uncharacterized protein LOC124915434 n=1 Tax=Impatiens glandulifera TaxID=253017 RepID=UPI001FB0A59A|nr:uncharacterized protein LOC124915434 [Impatiens glandulifera]